MASLEEYFSDNQTDLNYFMGEFSKDVLTYILHQSVVYGDNGHDLALDLLIHFQKSQNLIGVYILNMIQHIKIIL